MSLLNACETLYGLEGYGLRPLAGGVTDHTYALEHAGAETFVLRVERPEVADIPSHEQVLLFLEECSYPAPRVIRPLDGSPVTEHHGCNLVLTSFVDGVLVETGANTPAGLYEMGRAIGRLHALSPLDAGLPMAECMPETRVARAEGRLATIAHQVPVEWQDRFDGMLRSLAEIPSFADLPACLIHNDCHPGNAVCRADGEVILIDWDGAGLGPAVLDLGFLLITADTYTPDVPTLGTSNARVNAIVDGYCGYRLPDQAELEQLADAIRFRVTIINAAVFTELVKRGEFSELSTSWWDGCAEAHELANRARRRFDEHRLQDRASG
jgi:Ser/Thr protein kinase RdoA (MazF antagonist)